MLRAANELNISKSRSLRDPKRARGYYGVMRGGRALTSLARAVAKWAVIAAAAAAAAAAAETEIERTRLLRRSLKF